MSFAKTLTPTRKFPVRKCQEDGQTTSYGSSGKETTSKARHKRSQTWRLTDAGKVRSGPGCAPKSARVFPNHEVRLNCRHSFCLQLTAQRTYTGDMRLHPLLQILLFEQLLLQGFLCLSCRLGSFLGG